MNPKLPLIAAASVTATTLIPSLPNSDLSPATCALAQSFPP